MMNLEPLIRRVLSEQSTDWHGIQGLSHWGRVYTNGLRVAEESGANVRVVELFAFLHDSKRWNDGADIGHGARGAEFARQNALGLAAACEKTKGHRCFGKKLDALATASARMAHLQPVEEEKEAVADATQPQK